MIRFILVLLFLFSISWGYEDIRIDSVTSVYDGDSFRANIKGYPAICGENMGIRLGGIDTPEMRDKCPSIKEMAIEARDYLRKVLAKGAVIELRNVKRGKYFRFVGDLYVDGVDIGKSLIDKGLAHRYSGGKKQKWKCYDNGDGNL